MARIFGSARAIGSYPLGTLGLTRARVQLSALPAICSIVQLFYCPSVREKPAFENQTGIDILGLPSGVGDEAARGLDG